MNDYDLEILKTRLTRLEVRVTQLEVDRFTSSDGVRLADQIRELKLAVAELQSEELEDPELTPNEEAALVALEQTDYEDDSPEAVAFVTGFLRAYE